MIPDCLAPEGGHLSPRQLVVQVTDEELHEIITLLLGCLQIKWTDKKGNLVFSPVLTSHQPGSAFS